MKKIILILFAIILASTFVSASSCPENWILVPGNAAFNTSDFCVMKYEAKNDGSNNPISQADSAPWVSITQTDAIAECASLGTGYNLMTNAEWMTIARNIEQQTANWADGVIGSTVASGGGLYRGNVGITDSASYDGLNPEYGTGRNSKAELALSNGATIWDLSGNVWEWTNDTIACAGEECTIDEMPYGIIPASGWIEFTAINTYGSLSYDEIRPSNSNWNAGYGVGRLYTDYDAAYPSGNIHAFRRGGDWHHGAHVGVFTLFLYNAPSGSYTSVGFRCITALSSIEPTYTTFTSQETTNFSEGDVTNVTSLTLAIDNKGKIAFPSDHNINAENEDYDTNIKIEDAMIYVNSASLDSSFNNSATLT
ncbi:MAG: SUMF1/EgtB/PvdO family nonheme iron enzyme, partial [Nanoarchaeota archaeon]|nr:SUMF1/EgtB/PvdO family nonheme iron enzyme [Nanoarchaeota archaeon]